MGDEMQPDRRDNTMIEVVKSVARIEAKLEAMTSQMVSINTEKASKEIQNQHTIEIRGLAVDQEKTKTKVTLIMGGLIALQVVWGIVVVLLKYIV